MELLGKGMPRYTGRISVSAYSPRRAWQKLPAIIRPEPSFAAHRKMLLVRPIRIRRARSRDLEVPSVGRCEHIGI
jgi:hypothetical protein